MFNLSITSGYCWPIAAWLFSLHSSIYLPAQSGIQYIEAYRQNTLQTLRFAWLRLVFKAQFNVKHGRSFYCCKRRSLSPNNIIIMDLFPHRSKRGVEKKANYPNIWDKRSLFSMLERRLSHRGFKPEDKRWLKWVHVSWKSHWASSYRLCFINQVDVISCINYVTNRLGNSR